jgi:hypothetical protein
MLSSSSSRQQEAPTVGSTNTITRQALANHALYRQHKRFELVSTLTNRNELFVALFRYIHSAISLQNTCGSVPSFPSQ